MELTERPGHRGREGWTAHLTRLFAGAALVLLPTAGCRHSHTDADRGDQAAHEFNRAFLDAHQAHSRQN